MHIREDSEAIVRGETGRFANPPLFVKESVEYTPYRDPRQQANFEAHLIRRGEIPLRDNAGLCESVHRRPPRNASQAMYW